jgi:prepilin-type N-terminal cleavage/methylation domain-containing protein
MFRQAFTMVELVFVIVIIGILATVAVPKLAATRDDASESVLCQNISICVMDMASKYTATHNVSLTDSEACQKGDVSPLVSLDSSSITVSGAPSFCSDLNRKHSFGGSNISL